LLDQLAHDAPENVPIRSTLTLTHREIAETIGASRETVTRLFAQFKRKGWIEVRGSALTLKDRAALENLRDNHPREETPGTCSLVEARDGRVTSPQPTWSKTTIPILSNLLVECPHLLRC
jgi:DNA-binding transcriptional MocR family regulator